MKKGTKVVTPDGAEAKVTEVVDLGHRRRVHVESDSGVKTVWHEHQLTLPKK